MMRQPIIVANTSNTDVKRSGYCTSIFDKPELECDCFGLVKEFQDYFWDKYEIYVTSGDLQRVERKLEGWKKHAVIHFPYNVQFTKVH